MLSVDNTSEMSWMKEEKKTIPHLSYLPVDIPLLHVGESPCGDRQPSGHVNTNHAVIWNPKNFILLTPFESEWLKNKQKENLLDYHS